MDVVEKMKNQRRVVLDKDIIKKMYINKPDDGNLRDAIVEFHHAYDIAEQKFIKQINEIDTLYIADKERYSYNLGRF